MAKQIARLLKADLQETSDLKSIARMLSKKGRGEDTILAHITPKEARILKEAGGSGSINPDTGLLEFEGGFEDYGSFVSPDSVFRTGVETPPVETSSVPVDVSSQVSPPAGSEFSTPAYTGPVYGQAAPDVAAAPAAGVPAAAATAYPQGMMDFPAGVSAEGAPAMAAPGVRPDVFAKDITPPGLADRAGDILGAIKTTGGDVLSALTKDLKAPDYLRLAGAGAGAVAGRAQAQKAAQQIQQAVQEQKQISQPYTKAGQELQRAAMAGELTPQSAQAYQALQAQMRQGIEARGGVGVAQAQAQLEAFRQNLLQNQYNYGLQVAQIGDNIALGAIRTGMQLDQQLAQANQAFYTQLAAIAGGGTYGTQQQTTGRP